MAALEFAENSSEEVSRTFDSLAAALRERDWNGAAAFCSGAFRAVDWSALKGVPETLPVGIERTSFAPALEPVVDPTALRRRGGRLEDWKEIEFVQPLDRADFRAASRSGAGCASR